MRKYRIKVCTMGNGSVKYAPEFAILLSDAYQKAYGYKRPEWKPVNPRKSMFDTLENAKGAIETVHARYLGESVVSEETLAYIPTGVQNG